MRLNSFTFSTCTIHQVLHDAATPQELNVLTLARRDGAQLISSQYRPKNIRIVGTVKGATRAELEQHVDELKQQCTVTAGNLDLAYAGSYRRYTVATSNLTVTREHYHVTRAPFELTLVVLDPPFAEKITGLGGERVVSQVVTADALTSAFERTCTFGGSAPPAPTVRYVIDTAGNLGELRFSNLSTNSQIAVATAFADGDELLIDTANRTVQLNRQNVEFEGSLPLFTIGSNRTRLQPTATDAPVALQTAYDTQLQCLNSIYYAQRFSPSATGDVSRVDVILRNNRPDGTWTCKISPDGGGYPLGSLVHPNAQSVLYGSLIGVGSFQWFTFLFSPFSLTAGTPYWIWLFPSAPADFTWKALSGAAASNPVKTNGLQDVNAQLTYKVYADLPLTTAFDNKITYTERYL
jgi:hypothetical protein